MKKKFNSTINHDVPHLQNITLGMSICGSQIGQCPHIAQLPLSLSSSFEIHVFKFLRVSCNQSLNVSSISFEFNNYFRKGTLFSHLVINKLNNLVFTPTINTKMVIICNHHAVQMQRHRHLALTVMSR